MSRLRSDARDPGDGLGLKRLPEATPRGSSSRVSARPVVHQVRIALGLISACAVLCGVLIMQRKVPPSLPVNVPTGILGDLFPNPYWVLVGTVYALVGCVGAYFWLPGYLRSRHLAAPVRETEPDVGKGVSPPEVASAASEVRGGRRGRVQALVQGQRGCCARVVAEAFRPKSSEEAASPDQGHRAKALFYGLDGLSHTILPDRALVYGGGAAVLVAAALYLYVLFHLHQTGLGELACLAGSVMLGGFALWVGTESRSAGRRLSASLRWVDCIAIVVIMAGVIVINARDLSSWVYAYWGDEWPFYSVAWQILHGAPFDPLSQAGVYGYHPITDSLYMALVMRILGATAFGWKMSAVLAVALPVAPLYWLGKQLGGSVFATTASLIYASCPLLWAFAHLGYNNNDALLVMIPAAALFFVGARDERPVLLYVAGACAGAGWYTIYSARFMIVILAVILLTDRRGGWRAQARRLLVLLGGFALVALPFVLDNGRSTIDDMLLMTSVATGHHVARPSNLIEQNTVRALYSFLYATEDNHYTFGALFDALSGASLCVGFILALRRMDTLWSRFVLLWFLISLALVTPLNYGPEISVTRSMVIVPPAALLAALGLLSVCRAVGLAAGRKDYGTAFSFSLVITLITVLTLNLLHFSAATSQAERYPPYPNTVLVMRTLLTMPHVTAILPANQSDPTWGLCTIAHGYGIDPGHVAYVSRRHVLPFCPAEPGGKLKPARRVLLLLDDPQAVKRCGVAATTVLQENQGTLWIYRFAVPPGPPSTYAARVRRQIVRACPTLFT